MASPKATKTNLRRGRAPPAEDVRCPPNGKAESHGVSGGRSPAELSASGPPSWVYTARLPRFLQVTTTAPLALPRPESHFRSEVLVPGSL